MKFDQPISIIIPTFNEAKNIGRVLKVLKNLKWIDEIILVDDNSSDRTIKIVQSFHLANLTIIKNQTNLGKGGTMVAGIKKARHNLLLFLDADLVDLKEQHLLKILSPIIFTHEADLVLGVFAIKYLKKHMVTKIANRAFPSITGQRAIWKKDLPSLSKMKKVRFGVDYLITKHIPKNRRMVMKLEGLSQITKEGKGDFAKALRDRVKMYQQIIKEFKK